MLFTAWLGLYFAQSRLISLRRVDWHRRLGLAGVVLAVVMVITGLEAGINAAAEGGAPPGFTPIGAMALPVFSAAVFAMLVGGAIAWRHRSDIHQRLMVLATISIAAPGIGRVVRMLLGHFSAAGIMAMTAALIAWCMAYDWMKARRIHAAYLLGGFLVLASWPLRMLVSRTGWWQEFGMRLVT